jgi:hypothetical protein
MGNSMKPEARAVWGSKGGQDLMRKFLAGKAPSESDQPTLDALHQLNQAQSQQQGQAPQAQQPPARSQQAK